MAIVLSFYTECVLFNSYRPDSPATILDEATPDGAVLIYWIGILTIQALFCMPSTTSAEEIYGPSQPQQFIPSRLNKEDGEKVLPKDVVDDQGHPAEHALRSLPTQSDYTILPIPSIFYNRN